MNLYSEVKKLRERVAALEAIHEPKEDEIISPPLTLGDGEAISRSHDAAELPEGARGLGADLLPGNAWHGVPKDWDGGEDADE